MRLTALGAHKPFAQRQDTGVVAVLTDLDNQATDATTEMIDARATDDSGVSLHVNCLLKGETLTNRSMSYSIHGVKRPRGPHVVIKASIRG